MPKIIETPAIATPASKSTPKARKAPQPKNVAAAPAQPKGPMSQAEYLKMYGYSEAEISGHMAKMEEQFQANVEKANRERAAKQETDRIFDETENRLKNERETRKAQRLSELGQTIEKVVAEPKPIENPHGFALTKTESGKYLFAGHPVTAIFRWMGSQGWTWEDAMKTVKALGIPDGEVAEGTARIQVNAGKKGGDCGGRGPIPEISVDQATALSKAAGKYVEAPAAPAKKAPKPRAKKAPAILPVG